MKKLLLASLLFLVIAAWAADKIGDWNPEVKANSYVSFYGEKPWGGLYPMVVLEPFVSTSIWATDSVASESTGTWRIDRYLGQTGILQWSTADTAVVPGLRTLLYAVKVRVRNSPNENWYTVKNDTITDSLNTQFRDSLNFADPMFRAPFMSLMFTGLATNKKGKAATISATVKLERTD